MRIVILSRSENVHADAVAEFVKGRAIVDRINFDFDILEPHGFPQVVMGQKQKEPDAVFIHHPRISYKDEWFVDEVERKLFVASWDSLKDWMEAQFPHALWVNRPSSILKSRNVLGQLRLARLLNLKTPDTLFTNQVDELRRFAGDSLIVLKQGNLGINLDKKRILTSTVDIETINADMLRGCPCLFQRYVPKLFELRVHVIGDSVLTCKIDSQASDKTSIDWRNYDLEHTPHSSFDLDSSIGERCVELVKRLGLEFGIIDMIATPLGEWVFLECNAQGHWIWIEELTGLPITKTLCEYILNSSA